jgi:6-phosphogluconolactonase
MTLDEAREQFATTLQSEFHGDPHFDVVLNGIGPDGHVASLFPGRDHGLPDEYVIAVEESPKPPTERLSLTFSALNRGERVWIIAAGADKAHAIGELVSGAPEDMIPATALRGTVETALYLDEAAASSIPR